MRVVAFAGPSLVPDRRAAWPGVTWRGPACAGDFVRALDDGFDIIALIDGYFDHRPAPWHKEILAAIAAGRTVVGAASMGALRAAELDRFGMRGVGAIYHAYRSGLLTGDDDVALVHAPEALNWAPVSVAMVDVRATLAAFLASGKLTRADARRMRDVAHAIFFQDRDWPALVARWTAAGIDPALAQAVADGHVQLKAQDAERCMDFACASQGIDCQPLSVPQTVYLTRLQAAVRSNAA